MTDKFNAEGYYDSVTYEVLNRIEKEERAARKAASFKPVVYVCSPYSGDIERNTANTRMYSRFAVAKNTIPFIRLMKTEIFRWQYLVQMIQMGK